MKNKQSKKNTFEKIDQRTANERATEDVSVICLVEKKRVYVARSWQP